MHSTRGFTLFTALVGFVLIVLGFLLANSMLHSEDNLQQTIASIDEQSEMQSLSDLMQADAFQYLNWYFRVILENYLTDTTYSYELNYVAGNNLQQFIDDFAGGTLKSTGFAEFLTRGLTNSFVGSGRTFKNYRVCLISCNQDEQEAWLSIHTNKLRETLKRLIDEEIKQKKLIEPIGCPDCDDGHCVNGSFYVNLDLTLRYVDGPMAGQYVITDADLEDFPQISIESLASGRVIRQPILPRNYFRIFVPNRFMKAICSASEVAKNNLFTTSGSAGSNPLRQMGLGFCDTGCNPRNDPFVPMTSPTTITGNLCPGTRVKSCPAGSPASCVEDRLQEISLQTTVLKEVNTACSNGLCEPFVYNPGDTENMRQRLQNLVGSAITGSISPSTVGLNYGPEQKFTLEVDSSSILNFTRVESQAFKTKTILLNYDGVVPTSSGIGEAYCVRPVAVGAIVGFREGDEKYRVLDESTLGKDHVYRILIGSGLDASAVGGTTITNCTSNLVTSSPEVPPTGPFLSVKCGDNFTCTCQP